MVNGLLCWIFFFFQAEDGIRDRSPSRGLGDVYKRQTLTMQHWRSYHIDLQLIAGVWLPILKITEAGDTSFVRKLENAMEDNSELKRSIQSNARATQLTFDF